MDIKGQTRERLLALIKGSPWKVFLCSDIYMTDKADYPTPKSELNHYFGWTHLKEQTKFFG